MSHLLEGLDEDPKQTTSESQYDSETIQPEPEQSKSKSAPIQKPSKKSKKKRSESKTNRMVIQNQAGLHSLEVDLANFKTEILAKLESLGQSSTLPEEVRTALIALLQADYTRFIKYRYGNFVDYVETIASHFSITLIKPKKKSKKKPQVKK